MTDLDINERVSDGVEETSAEEVFVPSVQADELVTQYLPEGPWRCFHCDELFTQHWTARDHFGHDEGATPACKIKAGEIGIVEALRRAERDAGDAWFALQNESSTTAKAFRAMQGRHQSQLTAMEQLGYERGPSDAKAHPETLGLQIAATGAQ